jgi:hypothetical protein
MTTSNLTVGQITGSSSNSGTINLPTANKIVGADSGSIRTPGMILQVVNTVYTGQFTATVSSGYATVPGLTTAITPLYSSSKILVQLNGNFANLAYQLRGNIRRNGTLIAAGTPAGSRPPVTFMFNDYDANYNSYNVYTIATSILDAPASTSTQTYTVEIGSYSSDGAGGFCACNRNYTWQNTAEYDALPVSTLTLMEVAA